MRKRHIEIIHFIVLIILNVIINLKNVINQWPFVACIIETSNRPQTIADMENNNVF